MGFNVSKPKPANKLGQRRSTSLENIADEYMKRSSYKRSQTKYGVDLQEDEFAEDEPLEVVSLKVEVRFRRLSRHTDVHKVPRTGPPTPLRTSVDMPPPSPTEAWKDVHNTKDVHTKE